jgi:hypothetical protein
VLTFIIIFINLGMSSHQYSEEREEARSLIEVDIPTLAKKKIDMV